MLRCLHTSCAPARGVALAVVAEVPVSSSLDPMAVLAISAADLRHAGIFVICMILAIGVHEFAHAWAADRLGDSTPQRQGRLTLNPVAHMDPIGTLLLPLVLVVSGTQLFFGWGRPVETIPTNYTRRITMRAGQAIVAAAGPLSNLLQAGVALALIAGLGAAGVLGTLGPDHPLIIYYVLNVVLFGFNLVPLHPLDGGKVLGWLLGVRYQHIDEFLMRHGGLILVGIIVMPVLLGAPSPLQFLLAPILDAATWLLGRVA